MKTRKLIAALRRDPVHVALEAMWRAWKPHRAARLHVVIQRGQPPLRLRPIGYYRPDFDAVREFGAPIVAYADDICAGRFPFLGYETAPLGFPPAWNVDFVSGYEWERNPAAQVRTVVRNSGSDVKVPWELSRLQFLPVLAKAHLITGEARYREAAKRLFADWRANNPVGIGVNWTLAMEVALRGMSLCFMAGLLQPFTPSEEEWGRELTQSIWQHLIYTEAEIEFSHLISSNHYLSNIVGLHCMATFLDGPGMERRRGKYRGLIHREMLRQVYDDGGDYEASTAYHLLVQQMFTGAYLLMRADGCTPPQGFTQRLQAMCRYLAELADENGRLPHIGDSDDGRVELLVSDLHQMSAFRLSERDSLLVPGAIGLCDALFNLGTGGNPADAAWYGLRPGCASAARARCVVFPRSGIAVARAHDAEVVFSAIPNGIYGDGSHTHNDKLSIVARIRGIELFCDSGTGCYTRDTALRNQLRSTRSHNTVMVDGAEQNVITENVIFKLGDEAAVTPIEANDSAGEVRLSASHLGYNRIGVHHQRIVRAEPDRISIEDILSGAGEHSFEISWHLPAVWHVETAPEGGGFLISGPWSVCLKVDSESPLQLSHVPAPISRTYGGALEYGTRLKIAGSGPFPRALTTIVTWQ